MSRPLNGVDILMYHAIADGRGPLAIAPATFRMQMETIAHAGFRCVALRDYISARDQGRSEQERSVVLTFDDGYQNFMDVALPEIASRGWGCTVFLCSGLVGTPGGWDPDGRGRRPLLDWASATQAAAQGVELGAHAVTHTDLTTLTDDQARREIETSKEVIEQRTGCQVTSFAAPYGRSTQAIRREVARVYSCAVGTTMDRASAMSDRHDLPRIEMWYFRDPTLWRRYLEGATTYFAIRRTLRLARIAMRQMVGRR